MVKSKTRSKIHQVPAILSVLADPLLIPRYSLKSDEEVVMFKSSYLDTHEIDDGDIARLTNILQKQNTTLARVHLNNREKNRGVRRALIFCLKQ